MARRSTRYAIKRFGGAGRAWRRFYARLEGAALAVTCGERLVAILPNGQERELDSAELAKAECLVYLAPKDIYGGNHDNGMHSLWWEYRHVRG